MPSTLWYTAENEDHVAATIKWAARYMMSLDPIPAVYDIRLRTTYK